MDERAKEMRREYRREWYKNNKDKVRAQQERYWARKAAQTALESPGITAQEPDRN